MNSVLPARRIAEIEEQLAALKREFAEFSDRREIVILIDSMAPEAIDVIRPFHVIVEPYEDEFRAAFLDANLSAFGGTRAEAVWNLKDLISATFETISNLGEKRLGPGPARQLKVLTEFLQKKTDDAANHQRTGRENRKKA